jgi:hypothetical protein
MTQTKNNQNFTSAILLFETGEIRKQREHLAGFFLGMVLACFL